MCTDYVNEIGLKDIFMWCQMIFQFSAKITLRIIVDGLDLWQVTSLGHRMDVYQVQLLLAVSVDMSNTVNTVG